MLELQHEMIAEQFEELLLQEQAVADHYQALAREASDPAVRSRLQDILRDKRRHIELVRRLVEIMD